MITKLKLPKSIAYHKYEQMNESHQWDLQKHQTALHSLSLRDVAI